MLAACALAWALPLFTCSGVTQGELSGKVLQAAQQRPNTAHAMADTHGADARVVCSGRLAATD